MSSQHAARSKELTHGALYLRVREMSLRRGVVSHTGRRPGEPNIVAIMRGTGLSYGTLYHMLRKPWRIKRLDLATLERVCQFYQRQPADLFLYDAEAPPGVRPVPVRNPCGTRPDWVGGYLGRDGN